MPYPTPRRPSTIQASTTLPNNASSPTKPIASGAKPMPLTSLAPVFLIAA